MTLFDVYFHRLPLAAGCISDCGGKNGDTETCWEATATSDKIIVVFGTERVNNTHKGATKAVVGQNREARGELTPLVLR